jgi:hypothetical protein
MMLAGSLLLLSSTVAQADVLSIADPRYDIPNTATGVVRPTQGMNMTQVEQQFGAPANKRAAVGDPPITRWSYDSFDVFFEYDKVIHAVVNRPDPE